MIKFKLKTINFVLRRLGYVLVISTGDAGEPTTLWFEKKGSFDKRVKRVRKG